NEEKDEIFLSLQFEGASQAVKACLRVYDGLPCVASGGDAQKLFDHASYDVPYAELSLHIKLEDLPSLGLSQQQDGANGFFNRLPAEDLLGKILVLKIWPNRYGQHLEFITGEAAVIDANTLE